MADRHKTPFPDRIKRRPFFERFKKMTIQKIIFGGLFLRILNKRGVLFGTAL